MYPSLDTLTLSHCKNNFLHNLNMWWFLGVHFSIQTGHTILIVEKYHTSIYILNYFDNNGFFVSNFINVNN